MLKKRINETEGLGRERDRRQDWVKRDEGMEELIRKRKEGRE